MSKVHLCIWSRIYMRYGILPKPKYPCINAPSLVMAYEEELRKQTSPTQAHFPRSAMIMMPRNKQTNINVTRLPSLVRVGLNRKSLASNSTSPV